MRAKIRHELIKRFSNELQAHIPNFERCGEERGASGLAMWAWQIAPELTLFIALNIAEDCDNFAIEAGWSDDGKYPWNHLGFRYKDIGAPKLYDRLSFLWTTGKREYRWEIVPKMKKEKLFAKIDAESRKDWDEARRIELSYRFTVDEALIRVVPLVQDAVDKIREYGLPLFRRVASARNVTIPRALSLDA